MHSWGCSRYFRVIAYLKHLLLNWEWSQCAQPNSASLHMKDKTHRATFYFQSLSHYNLHFKGQGEEKGSYDNYILSPMVYYLLYISVGNLIPWSKKKKNSLVSEKQDDFHNCVMLRKTEAAKVTTYWYDVKYSWALKSFCDKKT